MKSAQTLNLAALLGNDCRRRHTDSYQDPRWPKIKSQQHTNLPEVLESHQSEEECFSQSYTNRRSRFIILILIKENSKWKRFSTL